MFDLTEEIQLEPEDRRLYRKLQVSLYLFAFILALYLSYLIIFPHKYFSFSFLNPASSQNNISITHFTDEAAPQNGKITGGNELYFDTDISGDFSKALITLNLNGASEKPSAASIAVRRSYQAFMYNLGDPIGWRNGSLLKYNGTYYIISDSDLRKFSTANIPVTLGYSEKSFREVSAEELTYNPLGADIAAADSYPNGALFRIADNYYIMNGQRLEKFVSDQAYLSKYDPSAALMKDTSFLNDHPISDDLVGFSDGTLIANGGSVFIVSNGKLLPVDNVQTFAGKGYNWNDVLNVGEDEIAIYQKDKLFNIKSPHPNGTIFKTSEDSKYYIVENGKKHLLPSEGIAASWLKKEPIMVSEKALEIYARCTFKKNLWNTSNYSCEIPLDKFSDLIGFNYEFSLASDTDIRMDSLSVDYKKNVNKKNFKSFAIGLYNSILGTYAPTQPN
ncbi:MAG: hypothetical protein WC022_04295 [Parcubacteria group bacterium]